MENMRLMYAAGCPMSRGTGASTVSDAYLVKAFNGIDAHPAKPVQRERRLGAAVGVTTARVQTIDFLTVPSALTRERRT